MIDSFRQFDGDLVRRIKQMKSGGKHLKNVLIVFLTLLHEELADLINESEELQEESESEDEEWETIKCFFKSEPQTTAMIHGLRQQLRNRKISDGYFKKAAAIYESSLLSNQDGEDSQEERLISEAFDGLIRNIFEYEFGISGKDYLGLFGSTKPANRQLEVIYEVENSAMIDCSQSSPMVHFDRSRPESQEKVRLSHFTPQRSGEFKSLRSSADAHQFLKKVQIEATAATSNPKPEEPRRKAEEEALIQAEESSYTTMFGQSQSSHQSKAPGEDRFAKQLSTTASAVRRVKVRKSELEEIKNEIAQKRRDFLSKLNSKYRLHIQP